MPNFLPRPKYPDERRYQFIDNVTYYAGAHSFKAGVDINYVREDIINLFQGGGVYAYGSLQTIAADCPPARPAACRSPDANPARHYTSYNQAFDLRGGGLRGDAFFTTTDYNFFIQDTWTREQPADAEPRPALRVPAAAAAGRGRGQRRRLNGNPAYPQTRASQDKNNWGPRVGFTYDIGGEPQDRRPRRLRPLLRPHQQQRALQRADQQRGDVRDLQLHADGGRRATRIRTCSRRRRATPALGPSIQYLSPDLERPEIHMAEVTVERLDRAGTSTVSASYLYSQGTQPADLHRHATCRRRTPQVDVRRWAARASARSRSTAAPRPDANGSATPSRSLGVVESTYHGARAAGEQALQQRPAVQRRTTRCRRRRTRAELDDVHLELLDASFDPNDLAGEEGPSTFDRRHRFVASFHYAPELLWGVQVGGIVHVRERPAARRRRSAAASSGDRRGRDDRTTNGTRRLVPRAVRRAQQLPSGRPQDVRHAALEGVQPRRTAGSSSLLWEAFNVFNMANYTGVRRRPGTAVASSSYDAATNRRRST